MNRINRLIAVALLALPLAFTGCVSSDAAGKRISSFASATTQVAENTKNALDTVERKHFDVQVARTVVNYDSKGFDPANFKPLFPAETREVRDAVLDAMATYAQNLSALMSNEQLDKLDEAATKFGGRLARVNKTIGETKYFAGDKPLTDDQLKIVTAAVEATGNWIIRIKREKGVRNAIKSMDTNIAIICEAFSRDFKTLRSTTANTYNQMQMAQNKFIQDNKEKMNPASKREEIRTLAHLVTEARDADATFAAMERSVTKLREAHSKLLDAFTKNKVGVDSAIGQLIEEGQRVKKYYDSLDKK